MYSDGYLRRDDPVLSGNSSLDRSIMETKKFLRSIRHDFDAIVVRGMSGVTVGAILAYQWKKQLVIVRKESDTTHGVPIEGKNLVDLHSVRYIILDDFTSSGTTMREMLTALHAYGFPPPTHLAFYKPDTMLVPPTSLGLKWGGVPFIVKERKSRSLYSLTPEERIAA